MGLPMDTHDAADAPDSGGWIYPVCPGALTQHICVTPQLLSLEFMRTMPGLHMCFSCISVLFTSKASGGQSAV